MRLMKKIIFSLSALLVALSFSNCSKDEAPATPSIEKTPFTICVLPESRTSNDGMNTVWDEGDAVSVFHAVTGSTEYGTNDEFTCTADEVTEFKGYLTETLEEGQAYDWYVIYPYNTYIKTIANTNGGRYYIGCRSDKNQTQTGNNSMTHIAGSDFPLYGTVENVAAQTTPAVTLSHVASLVEFKITNKTTAPITIAGIDFTSTEDIVGNYYIDFSGDELDYIVYNNYAVATAKLVVDEGEELAVGESATFYMGVKPHKVVNGELKVVVKTSAGNVEKTLSGVNTTFKAGKMKTLSVEVDAVEEATVYSIPFEDDLSWMAGISTEITADKLDEHYTEVYKVYGENDVLKFGTGDYRGYLTTGMFDLTEDFVVVVRAKTYSADSSTLSVTAGGTTSDAVTLTGVYKTYTFAFDALAANGAITLNVLGKRGYISYIAIQKAGYVPAPEVFVTSGDVVADANGLEGAITYTIDYPIDGQEVVATATAEWIEVGTPADGSIAYTIKANDTTDKREAEIILSYEGAVNVPVKVTQTAPESKTAVTKTIVFEDAGWSRAQDVTTEPHLFDDITISFVKLSGSNAPKYYDGAVRMYATSSITIEAPGTISKIELTHETTNYTKNLTADVGDYSTAGTVGTWVGSGKTVVLKHLESGQNRIKSVKITYEPTE